MRRIFIGSLKQEGKSLNNSKLHQTQKEPSCGSFCIWYGQQDLNILAPLGASCAEKTQIFLLSGNLHRFRITHYRTKRKRSPSGSLCVWYGQQDLNLHSKESDPKSDASANSAMPAEWISVKTQNVGEKEKSKLNTKGVQLALTWRRRWDSNPRAILLATRFRVETVMTTSIHLRRC